MRRKCIARACNTCTNTNRQRRNYDAAIEWRNDYSANHYTTDNDATNNNSAHNDAAVFGWKRIRRIGVWRQRFRRRGCNWCRLCLHL